MAAELLGQPLYAWIGTYLIHSTVLCGAAWAFDAWTRRHAAGERTLGHARERFWKAALFLPLMTTLAQHGGQLWLWSVEGARVETAVEPLLTRVLEPHAARALPLEVLSAPAAASSWHPGWGTLALLVWSLGLLFAAWSWLREWRSLARALRGLSPCADAELCATFEELCAGDPALAQTRLYVGRKLLVPLTLGWTTPRVVVPERALRELGEDERRAMLAHELAHARRRDPLWFTAARAVESLFFLQPLNRLARVRLQDEAEFLADRWALERGVEPLSLASCLTEVAGWVVALRQPLPVPGMAARGARLTRRVERLLDERRAPLALRRAPWALAIFVLALGSAVAAVPGPATPRRSVPQLASTPEPATERAAIGATVAAAVSDDLAGDLALLEQELDALANAAEERELDPSWYERLGELRDRLQILQCSLQALSALDDQADTADTPANVADAETEPNTSTHPQ